MKQKNFSRFAILSILLSIIGIIVAALSQQPDDLLFSLGLTFIFVAALLMAGSFVLDRLRRIGAEAWAIGSILVWIGYLFFALPLIGFAWNFLSGFQQLLFFSIGVFLILLGFTTEYYDLNIRLIHFIERTRKRFHEVWDTIRQTFLRSNWTRFASVTVIVDIISFPFPDVLRPLSVLSPSLSLNEHRVILLGIALLCLLAEFREMIYLALSSFFNVLYIFIYGIFRRLRHIPSLIQRLFELLLDLGRRMGNAIRRTAEFGTYNTYIFGFVISIVIGILAFTREDSTLFATSLLAIIASLSILLIQKPQQVASRIGQVQQIAYRRSTIVRNFANRRKDIICPSCSQQLASSASHCYRCDNPIPKCSVCKGIILQNSRTLRCNFCEQVGHLEHLTRWVQINPICPHCRRTWEAS
ncbi:MAG: hypothetical protein ACW98K_10535 [Candidatus Kariarchaeaceae archaeon]|jgi:hypothetical protein